jgi:F-type H+-transporting ATPase subunit epsilon
VSVLQVELVAADRKVWSGEARMVAARSTEGDLGILPGHTPLLGVLVTGEVRIDTGSGKESVTIDSGFLSVDHDRVTIVAEQVDASSLSQAPADD